MTSRSISSLSVCALAASLAFTPVLLATAQTTATPDASASNSAPATPAEPAPAPAPAAAPATPAPADTTSTPTTAPEERPTTYTMVAGDSLDSVAHKFNTSIRALAKLNKIHRSEYRKLRAGRVLQIPPAKTDAATTAK